MENNSEYYNQINYKICRLILTQNYIVFLGIQFCNFYLNLSFTGHLTSDTKNHKPTSINVAAVIKVP